MITRKHLLLAIAATCLLTMFLITIAPIRSQTAGQYDPWLDVNDDGKIDGKDITPSARAFGTFGDPTKNVVTTANSSQNTYYTTINGLSGWTFQANTAGFRKVTVNFYATTTPPGMWPYNIYVGFNLGYTNSTYQVDSFVDTAWEPVMYPKTPSGFVNSTTRVYDVTGSQMWIYVYNPNPPAPFTTITMWFSIFMTA
jgi:hypothetical protein